MGILRGVLSKLGLNNIYADRSPIRVFLLDDDTRRHAWFAKRFDGDHLDIADDVAGAREFLSVNHRRREHGLRHRPLARFTPGIAARLDHSCPHAQCRRSNEDGRRTAPRRTPGRVRSLSPTCTENQELLAQIKPLIENRELQIERAFLLFTIHDFLLTNLVARDGIEPPTPAFSGPRSTD
jgi:hypothetical protein